MLPRNYAHQEDDHTDEIRVSQADAGTLSLLRQGSARGIAGRDIADTPALQGAGTQYEDDIQPTVRPGTTRATSRGYGAHLAARVIADIPGRLLARCPDKCLPVHLLRRSGQGVHLLPKHAYLLPHPGWSPWF